MQGGTTGQQQQQQQHQQQQQQQDNKQVRRSGQPHNLRRGNSGTLEGAGIWVGTAFIRLCLIQLFFFLLLFFLRCSSPPPPPRPDATYHFFAVR